MATEELCKIFITGLIEYNLTSEDMKGLDTQACVGIRKDAE